MEMKTHLHEFGAISEFLSPEKRSIFRRINIEYLWLLQRRKPEEMPAIIRAGVQSNLQLEMESSRGEGESPPPSQLTELARRIMQHPQIFTALASLEIARPLQRLSGIPQPLEAQEKPLAHSATAVSNELTRQANNDIREAMAGDREHGKWLLIAAFKQLHKAIRLNPRNYKAHFDYAWLCSFFFRNPAKAAFHLEKAVQEAFELHPGFTIFALRYLAETRRDLHKYDGAVEAANEAYMLDREHTPQIQFDLARYLTLAQQHEKAAKYLEGLLGEYPEYYWQVVAEPDFRSNPDVAGLIEALFWEFLPADDTGVGDISYANEINETALAQTLVENRSINLQTPPPGSLPEMDPTLDADFETDEDFDEILEEMGGDRDFYEVEDGAQDDKRYDETGDAPFDRAKNPPIEHGSIAPEEPAEETLIGRAAHLSPEEPENGEASGIPAGTEHLPEGKAPAANLDRPNTDEAGQSPHFLDLFVVDDKDGEAPAPVSPATSPENPEPVAPDGDNRRSGDFPGDLSGAGPDRTEPLPDRGDTLPDQPETHSKRVPVPEPLPAEEPPVPPQRESSGKPPAGRTEETPREVSPGEAPASPPAATEEATVGDVPRTDANGKHPADPPVAPAQPNAIIVKPAQREEIRHKAPSPAPVLAEVPSENPDAQLENVLNHIRHTYVESTAASPEPEEQPAPPVPDLDDLIEMFDNFSLAAEAELPEAPESGATPATGETVPAELTVENSAEMPQAGELAEMPEDNLGLPHARELLEEVGGLINAGDTDDLSEALSPVIVPPEDSHRPAENETPDRPETSSPIDEEVLQLLQRIGQRFDGSTEDSGESGSFPDETAEQPADPSEMLRTAEDDPLPPSSDGKELFQPEERALVPTPGQQAPMPGEGSDEDGQNLLELIERDGMEPAFHHGQPPDTDAAGDETEAQSELSVLLHQIEDSHLELDEDSPAEEELEPEPFLKLQEITPATPLPENESGISPGAGLPNEYERVIAEIRKEMELAKQRCAKLKSIFTRRDLERTQQRIEQIARDAIEKLPNIAEMDYPKYLRSTRRSLGRQVEFFRARHRIISRLKRA